MSEKRRQDLASSQSPRPQRADSKEAPRPEAGFLPTTERLFSRLRLIRHDEEAIVQVLRQVPHIDRLHARIAVFQALGGYYTNAGPRALALCEHVFGLGTMYFPSEQRVAQAHGSPSGEAPRAAYPTGLEPKSEPVPALGPETAFDQGRIQTFCELLKRLVSQPILPPAAEILTLLDAVESHVAKAALLRLNDTLFPGESRFGKTYDWTLQQAAGEKEVSDHVSGRREMLERMLPAWPKTGRPKNPPPLPLETRLLHRRGQFGMSWLLGSWDQSATPEAKAQRRAGAEEKPVEDHPALAVLGQGGGEPLPEAVLARMNRLLGHDFAHVRIHTDARAAEVAELLGARALVLGTHVYFGTSQFAPGTPAGDRLLLHELVHVVQFDEGRLPGARGAGLEVSRPEDGAEQEAEARAESLGVDDGVDADHPRRARPNAAISPTRPPPNASRVASSGTTILRGPPPDGRGPAPSNIESIADILKNPDLLAGKLPKDIAPLVGKSPNWKVETLGKGAHRMRVADALAVEPRLYYDEAEATLVIRGVKGICLDVAEMDPDPEQVPRMTIDAITVFADEAFTAAGQEGRW